MARLAGLNSRFVEVSVATENETDSSSKMVLVFFENPQQNSPELYLEEKLLKAGKNLLKSPVAYQLFSWDYRSSVELKFPKDSPRKILERIKLAWQNAPYQVTAGYYELERRVYRCFAAKYPEFIGPDSEEPSGRCPDGKAIDGSDPGRRIGSR